MILVNDIIETKNLNLFNQAKELRYGLYKNNGIRIHCINTPFRQTVEHCESQTPIAYSNNKDELYEYADSVKLHNFEVTDSHCYNKNYGR